MFSERAPLANLHEERSDLGHELDTLIYDAARFSGFTCQVADELSAIFATLTRASLAEPCPWSANHLSKLSGGAPLEFSTKVGPVVAPALRYALEVGNPHLAPYERARSGVMAIARTAEHLGYTDGWWRVLPSVERLVSPAFPVSSRSRFWVWSGMDHVCADTSGQSVFPVLKIYLNLLNREVGKTRQRLEETLRAAAIPLSSALERGLDILDQAGFVHELGFGLLPGARIACKVYYELYGWRRNLVRKLLELFELPDGTAALNPAIPGILTESLAAKSRAGIALRIDPQDGSVLELTAAMGFPPPMLSPGETRRRVLAWITDQDWKATPYQNLSDLLLPAWEVSGRPFGRLHTGFTRTVSAETAHTTFYLRPYIPTSKPLTG